MFSVRDKQMTKFYENCQDEIKKTKLDKYSEIKLNKIKSENFYKGVMEENEKLKSLVKS